MSLFNQIYEKFKISESVEGLDDTKDVYGYSLKTFIAEELELFDAFADAILRDAEAKKRDLQRHTDGTNHSASLIVQYTHNSEFNRVVDNLKKGMTAPAWSYFYHPAIKQVGGIKLTQETDKSFSLTFGGETIRNQSNTCSESQNWKECIIERLKFFIIDGFYMFLDSFPFKSVSSSSSLNKSLKDFFEWREDKVKFKQLGIKLPELEGIFENESKQDYMFVVTFEKTYQLEKLEKILALMMSLQGSSDVAYEVNDKQQLVLTIKDLERWDFNDKQERDRFARTFYNTYNSVTQQLKPRVSYTAVFKSKYEDVVKRLPELEGIFESKVEIDPNFSLMKEEATAIEEIAEAAQKFFQAYEERIVALMKSLKKSVLELQDEKLNKYIGITHLRNDLRLTVGKVCKKHFDALEKYDQKTRYEKPLYTQYERIFLKPITGSSATTKGGVMLKYQDDVFEVSFDTYDYVLGEMVADSKSVEPSEVKDYLKKLLPFWLNAITTHNQWYFTNQYSEFRKEQTKFNKMKEQLPELEGIF